MTANSYMDNIERKIQQRRKKVQKVCEQQNNYTFIEPQMFKRILVDDSRELLYCVVFKVASTATKRTLIHSSGKANMSISRELDINNETLLSQYGLRLLSNYSMEQIAFRVKNYYSAMFVRHPLKRLLSAFRDRFEIEKDRQLYREVYGKNIIKTYRKRPTKESLQKGHDVKYHEFLKYVADLETAKHSNKKIKINPHWNTYKDNCRPCLVDYSFIGKLESFDEDINYLLHKISSTKVEMISKEYGPASYKTRKDTDAAYNEYYDKVPANIMDSVRKAFNIDFELYHYEFDKMGYDTPPSSETKTISVVNKHKGKPRIIKRKKRKSVHSVK